MFLNSGREVSSPLKMTPPTVAKSTPRSRLSKSRWVCVPVCEARLSVSDGISAVQATLSSSEIVSPLLVDVSVNGPAVAGGRVPYTITVGNVSAQSMDDVSVVYTVSPELSFHAVIDAEPNTNCGSSCIDGEEALWALGTLAAGESRTITINAPVVPGALAGSLITAPVRVTSSDVIDIVSKTTAVGN